MSFKPEVSTDGGKTFTSNALRFATHDEAKASASALMMRWLAVTDIRVSESDDPVNYRRDEGADKPLALDIK